MTPVLPLIQHIVNYTAAGKESFFSDRKTQDTVVRNLEIIGEAIKRVSVTLKEAHPDIAGSPPVFSRGPSDHNRGVEHGPGGLTRIIHDGSSRNR